MKKLNPTTPQPLSTQATAITPTLGALVEEVRALVQSARRTAVASINSLQVRTNFEIGRLIVEHEQQGQQRAAYGKAVLKHLAANLTAEFGRGYSQSNLEYMRKFSLMWPDWPGPISQKASGKFTLSPTSTTLGWSHYVLLMSIADENERRFYEIEAAQNGWSIPEFKRQVGSALYERLALSRDKARVQELAQEGHIVTRPADVLKDPYILEFLGLDEQAAYSETQLESAIISKLEHFLLELGKGFLFEARQKRFTFDEDHFYVDLVFYNRLLRRGRSLTVIG